MIFGFLVCTPLPSPFCVAVVTVKRGWSVNVPRESTDDGAVTPVSRSTGHLENELTHGWNTMRQRHPPSAVLYETPKFKLQNVREEEDKKSECGCYLCIEWNHAS